MAIIKETGNADPTLAPRDNVKQATSNLATGSSTSKDVLGLPKGSRIVVTDQPVTPVPGTGMPPVTAGTRYFPGDEIKILTGLTPQQSADLKSQLFYLGAYPKKYQPTTAVVDDKDVAAFRKAIDFAEATGKSWQEALVDPQFKLQLAASASSTGGVTSTDRSYTILTDKGESDAQLTDQFRSVFGADPTAKELTDYYNQLTALEKDRSKVRVNSNGQVITQTGLSAEEKQDLLMSAVQMGANSRVAAAEKEGADTTALKAISQGQFGQTVKQIRNAYAENGVPEPDMKTIYTKAVQSLYSKDALTNTLNVISENAKTQFPALAQYIDKGMSVKDMLSPYISTRARILEQSPAAIKLQDLAPVAQDPTGKLMNMKDYEISLRQDPNWRYTQNAQDTMSSIAQSVLKAFGKVS